MSDFGPLLKRASALQRAGDTGAADALYSRLLEHDPRNADVLGRRAIIALQGGKRRKAIQLLQRSLAAEAPAAIVRRNLDSLVSTLLAEKLPDEAAEKLARPIPSWEDQTAPESADLQVILSLSRHLMRFDRNEAALDLIKSIEDFIQEDAEALDLLGALQLRNGWHKEARATLSRAREKGSVGSALTAAVAAHALGDTTAASRETARYLDVAPMLLTKSRTSQTALIGVANVFTGRIAHVQTPRELHFGGNFVTQLRSRYASRYRFLSIFVQSENALQAMASAPTPDVVYNAAVNAEVLLTNTAVKRLSNIIGIWGAPAINHPKKAVRVTRDASRKLYSTIDGVIVPEIRRYKKDTGASQLILAIERDVGYPVIIRGVFEQKGANAFKADNQRELENALAQIRAIPFFYAIKFHDNRQGRFYRKIRAAVVGDLIQIMRADFDEHWNVHGRVAPERRAFYLNNPALLQEERAIALETDATLGPGVMAILRRLRERIPLDLFGIDFDVTKDGRVLLFEANASMNLLATVTPGMQPPREAEAVFMEGFHALVERLKASSIGR